MMYFIALNVCRPIWRINLMYVFIEIKILKIIIYKTTKKSLMFLHTSTTVAIRRTHSHL